MGPITADFYGRAGNFPAPPGCRGDDLDRELELGHDSSCEPAVAADLRHLLPHQGQSVFKYALLTAAFPPSLLPSFSLPSS